MKCLHPVRIPPRRALDGSVYSVVPCGRCEACLANRRRDWFFRNCQEWKANDFGVFATLTIDPEHYDARFSDGGVHECQNWLKRFRKYYDVLGVKVRYFLVSERGEKHGRLHFHALLYFKRVDGSNHTPLTCVAIQKAMQRTWQNGFTSANPVSFRDINYVCKYMLQDVNKKKAVTSCCLAVGLALEPFSLIPTRIIFGKIAAQ